jgi:hypothetical protein
MCRVFQADEMIMPREARLVRLDTRAKFRCTLDSGGRLLTVGPGVMEWSVWVPSTPSEPSLRFPIDRVSDLFFAKSMESGSDILLPACTKRQNLLKI